MRCSKQCFVKTETKATSLDLDFSVIVHIICIMGVAQIAFPILEFQPQPFAPLPLSQ